MEAFVLFDALTDVRGNFLEETEQRLYGKRRRGAGAYVLAAALIALLCFTTAMALDTDFRQKVLSLFTVSEEVPRENGRTVTLAEGIEAEYLFVPGYARTDAGMFLVCTDEVEMNQGSHYAAYAYENGALVRQEDHRFDEMFTAPDGKYRVTFDWAAHDGRVAVTWVAPRGDGNDILLLGGSPERYLILLNGRYPLLADLNAGAVTAPLAGFDGEELPYIDGCVWHSDDMTRWLLGSYSARAQEFFYFDTAKGEMQRATELCGRALSDEIYGTWPYGCQVLDGYMVCWWLEQDDSVFGHFSGCRIDLDTLEKLPLFDSLSGTVGVNSAALELKGVPGYDPGTASAYPLEEGLIYLPHSQRQGGRLALEMSADRSVTLIDMQTAERISVEGYTVPEQPFPRLTIIGNPSGDRVLIAGRSDETDGNFDNIAVLGLDGGVVLERRSAEGVNERYITWLDDDHFIITCSDDTDSRPQGDDSWFYIYDLS